MITIFQSNMLHTFLFYLYMIMKFTDELDNKIFIWRIEFELIPITTVIL